MSLSLWYTTYIHTYIHSYIHTFGQPTRLLIYQIAQVKVRHIHTYIHLPVLSKHLTKQSVDQQNLFALWPNREHVLNPSWVSHAEDLDIAEGCLQSFLVSAYVYFMCVRQEEEEGQHMRDGRMYICMYVCMYVWELIVHIKVGKSVVGKKTEWMESFFLYIHT